MPARIQFTTRKNKIPLQTVWFILQIIISFNTIHSGRWEIGNVRVTDAYCYQIDESFHFLGTI